jgi:chromosome partitioning protein
MPLILSVVSQKGGVGKSTICRAVAREFANIGWAVKIADLDISQGTSFQWRSRRLENNIQPDVPVEQFRDIAKAIKAAEQCDLLIFDGKPHSTKETADIARPADLIIIPTGLSLDDLRPSVVLAHDLVKAGIAQEKIVFALCRVGESEAEIADATGYLKETPYAILPGSLPEKTAYRRASDEGKALTETRYPSLNARAEELAQGIVDMISNLSKRNVA